MKIFRRCLTFALPLFLLLLLASPRQVDGRYTGQAREGELTQYGNQLEEEADPAIREHQEVSEGAANRSLFQMLLSALQKGEAKNDNKRGKQSKPCYWSLVSCY